jgi:hypothetical protein
MPNNGKICIKNVTIDIVSAKDVAMTEQKLGK